MRNSPNDGWAGLDGPADSPERSDDIPRLFARTFIGGEGERLMVHLTDLTMGRTLGPAATDAALRHLEGQRSLVAYMQAQIERGRGPASTES